ncbi:MAG: hypothetical protein KC417_11275 [Myxococcales bacterium]|nr:hypothetical protein [Myxococcales bacterium]
MKPLAITGLGVVSPLGVGREAFFEALRAAPKDLDRAFGMSTVLDATKVGDARVAEVWGFEPKKYLGEKGLRNFDRLTTFLIVAAKHALEDAGLKKDGAHVAYGPERTGICSATAYGSLDAITELVAVAELEDPRYINPAKFPNTVINAAAGYVSIWEDLRAPNMTVVDGNCGGLDVVLTASTHLNYRRADAFLVGGGEVLSDPLYLAFSMLGAVAQGDQKEGIHPGEGASYVCVERLDDAKARGARVEAQIVGYGTSFMAPSSPAVIVSASPESLERAIGAALDDAGVTAEDVDVVAGSASGLSRFDAAEHEAILRVFGDSVAVAAPKRLMGETFGASGAFGIATALGWMRGVPVAPLVQGNAPAQVRTVLITTLGYYGNVSAVVIKSEA